MYRFGVNVIGKLNRYIHVHVHAQSECLMHPTLKCPMYVFRVSGLELDLNRLQGQKQPLLRSSVCLLFRIAYQRVVDTMLLDDSPGRSKFLLHTLWCHCSARLRDTATPPATKSSRGSRSCPWTINMTPESQVTFSGLFN